MGLAVVASVFGRLMLSVGDLDIYGYPYSMLRTLSFAIFFFAGYYTSEQLMKTLTNNKSYVRLPVLAGVVAGIIALTTMVGLTAVEYLLKGSFNLQRIGLGDWRGMVLVGVSLTIAFGVGYLLLSVISNKRSILTQWGDNSLQIFLFHAFIVKSVEVMKPQLFPGRFSWVVISAFLTLASTALLGSSLFVRATAFLCYPLLYIQKTWNYIERMLTASTQKGSEP